MAHPVHSCAEVAQSLRDQGAQVTHRPSDGPCVGFGGEGAEPLKLHMECFVHVLRCVFSGGRRDRSFHKILKAA